MRKEFKAIIAAILAVWLFLMGFEIGSYREKQRIATQPSAQQTTLQQPQTTVPPETAAPTAPEPTAPAADVADVGNVITEITTYPDSELTAPSDTTSAAPTQPASDAEPDVSALSKRQILQRASEAINKLKNTKNMTARNQETISIQVVDCSAKSAVSIINSFISKKAGDKNVTYVFKDGKAVGHDDSGKEIKDEGEVTPNQIIPPTEAAFTLPKDGLQSASAAKNGAFVTYTLKLKEERSSIENPVPPYNSQAVGYLKMTDMQIPGATITGADMHYPGTTVTVTVDADGRVRQLQTHLPMEGTGTAKMGFLSGSASFEGFSTQNWTFTYA
ncbi:MAG: hypothetical protein IKH12_05365 [Clostridia bacterium]|nr:hypothetical protein [Clostridia bacterium]